MEGRDGGAQAGCDRAGSLVVALANADATALPLRDGAADLTLAAHMLYHVPDPAEALRELRRVTRPGGRVVIVLNGAGHLRELRAAVAAARGDDAKAMGERVTLDDGEALARTIFPKVTRHDFVSELRVPAPGPDRGLRALDVRHQPGGRPGSRGRDGRGHLSLDHRRPLHNHQPFRLPNLRSRLAPSAIVALSDRDLA